MIERYRSAIARAAWAGIAGRFAAGLCCSLPLLAAADAGQDGAIAALKAATLELIQAQAQEDPAAAEGPGSFALYIGNPEPGLLLDDVRIWIDQAPPQRYEYSDREALALHQSGLHRFLIATLAPGTHHLRADFTARYADAPPDHARAAATLEHDITVDAPRSAVELDLMNGGFMSKPDLRLQILQAGQPGADGAAAPGASAAGTFDVARVRYAAFLTAADRPFAAAIELLRLRAQLRGAALPADFNDRLADACEAFGVQQRARAADAEKAGAGAPGAEALAQSYANYNRGVDLIRQGQAPEGTALLAAIAGGKGDDAESATLRDRANLILGYAQLRNHTGANAVPLFSSVRSFGPYASAALLGLGWALLAPSGNGQFAQAAASAASGTQAPFPRIAVMLQPHLTDDIATLKRREPYHLQPASPQEEQMLRKALVPWLELVGGDPIDPAVQEGMLAIPYALNHVGAYEEARERYLRAMKLLQAVDTQLDAARQRVMSGRMMQTLDVREAANNGWPWWLAVYPKEHWWLADDPHDPLAAPENFYLQHLMADVAFRDALQDFHDLRLMSDAVEHMDRASGLQARIAAATAAQAGLLQNLAAAELSREQRYTHLYLGEAHFALAHMNEPDQAVAAK